MEILKNIDRMLVSWGMSPATADELDHFIALAVLILLALLADMVCRHIVLKGVAKLVKKTKATWDDVVFDHKKLANCEVQVRNEAGDLVATYVGTGYRKSVALTFD